MAAAQLHFALGSIRTPCSATSSRIRWRIPAIATAQHRPDGFVEKHVNRNLAEGDERMKVMEVLKSELLNDSVFEWTPDSRQWLDQMIDYNVPQGKLLRSGALIDCYKSLKQDPTEDELFLARVLGWCMEMFHSAGAIQDDLMDNSEMRRGKLCWYRVPKVGNIAINDGVLLQYQVGRVLRKHFGQQPYYLDLLDMFNDAQYQTMLGQMLDVISTVEGERDLSKYSWTLYHLTAKYKTSIFTYYCPVACALLLAGENLDHHVNVKDVLFDMGMHFQTLNDYQDCYEDPAKTGKIGRDIEDFKCTWLVLKAMELCNEQQKQILLEHYGKADPEGVAKVKGVYSDLGIKSLCETHLKNSFDDLQRRVEVHPCKAVHEMWANYTPYFKHWR